MRCDLCFSSKLIRSVQLGACYWTSHMATMVGKIAKELTHMVCHDGFIYFRIALSEFDI